MEEFLRQSDALFKVFSYFCTAINETRKKMVLGKETATEVIQTISELWAPLTDEQHQYLAESISIQHYKKNDIIYRENEASQYLFFLLKGKVKIYKEGVSRRQQIVRMAEVKGFFGYRAGLAETNYITEAAAFEDCTLCLIPLATIKRLICENHEIALYFIKRLAQLLGHADERIVSLTQKHLRGRLAETLIKLYESYGTDSKNCTLAIEPSREDLANLSNMTPSNAIRTLSSFVSEGLISTDGRKITIMNEPLLRLISKNG